MKVTVERAELLKSLGHVHRVVERRNTIPILANVLIKADTGKLSMKATDLDLEVIDSVAAEVSPGGATTVPAHMFYEIVRKLPEGSQIVIEGSGDRAVLSLRAGRSRFTLQTLPESDFPDLAAGEMTHSFKLAASDLKRLIDKTQFAISTEETRYYLNGIYLHTAGTAKAGTLRAVATDGHRLAQVELPLPQGAAGMPGIIVPRKTVGEVQRLIETGEGEVGDRIVRRQDPLLDRRRGADLKVDRRHLPGLWPRHPGQQRQEPDRRQEGFRGRGRPRLHRVERARPRGQALDHRRAAGAVGDQSGFAAAPPKRSKSNTKPIRSISVSTRAICSTSPRRSKARWPCSSSPTPARRR